MHGANSYRRRKDRWGCRWFAAPHRPIGFAGGIAALFWPSPAAAQDITGLVLVFVPAAVLAPFAALGIKWGILALARVPPGRGLLWSLLGLALLDLLLWEIAYPAWALFDLRIVPGWHLFSLPGGALLLLLLLAGANWALLLRDGRLGRMKPGWGRVLAFGFALLTPLCLLLLAALTWGLLLATGW